MGPDVRVSSSLGGTLSSLDTPSLVRRSMMTSPRSFCALLRKSASYRPAERLNESRKILSVLAGKTAG